MKRFRVSQLASFVGMFALASVGMAHYFGVRALDNPVPVVDRSQTVSEYLCVDAFGNEVTRNPQFDATRTECGEMAATLDGDELLFIERIDTQRQVTRTRTHEVFGSRSLELSPAHAAGLITASGPSGAAGNELVAPPPLKFSPGFGAKMNGNHAATDLTSYLAIIDGIIDDELQDSVYVNHLVAWYPWGLIESTEGVYDFSEVESDVAAVGALGKKIMLVFPFKCFQADCGSIAPPQHVGSVYQTNTMAMSNLATDGPGMVGVWEPDVLADYNAMIAAAAAIFDTNDTVIMASLGDEWATSMGGSFPGGYTGADYRDALYSMMDSCTAAWVETFCGAPINSLVEGYSDELMEYAYQAGGIAKTGPDALDDQGNNTFAGGNGATRIYLGLMPNTGAWSFPMCNGGDDDPGTIDDMQAIVEQYRFSNVAAIVYEDGDCDWDLSFLPHFAANTVGLTVYPGSLSADTTAPTVPTISSVTATSASEITVSWGAVTDTFSSSQLVSGIDSTNTYRLRRGGTIVASTSSTSFNDTGLTASTMYSYTVDAKDVDGNYSAQSSSDSDTTDATGGTVYWTADMEAGDLSEFDGFGVGGFSAVSNGEAYEGSYHAEAALTAGAIAVGEYHDYGTPGSVGTQVRDFWTQGAFSFDDFTGGWDGIAGKLFLYQWYDSTWMGGAFNNGNRKYQLILAVCGDDSAYEGQFCVELIEWDNEGGGSSINSSDLLVQNVTTPVGPTLDSWDVVRMQVVLDDDGDGTLGNTHGNGILRMWVNSTLVMEYTDVNFTNGDANVGIGRFLLALGDTWQGTDSAALWDDIQVASSADALSAMPSSPVVRVAAGGGDDNPDSLALATIVDGTTFDSADGSVTGGNLGSVATAAWGAGFGWDGGGWRITPNGFTSASEENVGIVVSNFIDTSEWEYADQQQTMGIAMLMFFESQFANYVANSGGDTMSMKWADIYLWDVGGSNNGGGRQTVILDHYEDFGSVWGGAAAGGYFGITDGGAGVQAFTDPYGSNPLNVATVGGRWVWLHYYTTTAGINGGFSAFYYKVEGDSGVTRAMLRYGDDNAYTWQDPSGGMDMTNDNGSGYFSGRVHTLAGYFESTINGDPTVFYGLDNFEFGNGYLTPPAGL